MTKYMDEQNIREIEARLDIVEIISETVQLNRRGNNYWGLCPFHPEKTPSFSVNRNKQMYYCFGCHAGGNIFSYVMKKEGLDFKEALELLAARAGIEIILPRDRKSLDKRKALIAVNNAATQFYADTLSSEKGRTARAYLEKRGLTPESISVFRLGYAPDDWNLVEEYLFKKGFAPEIIKASGLIKRSDNQNRFYDLFRNRIVFPIFMYNQDVVGFGGRSLGEAMPKYLNTAETELFSKRRNLYGLAQGRESIREKNSAFLVEGYMDCIKLHQAGIKNAVASLGTALTEEQASLLHRYAERVVVLYDGDEAGQRETMRAIKVLRAAGLQVEIVSLPPGKDPDEYIESYGKEGFWNYVKNNACSDIEFNLNRYIYTTPSLDLQAKIRIIGMLKPDIVDLPSALERDFYTKLLARKLEVAENLVGQELKTATGYRSHKKGLPSVEGDSASPAKAISLQERVLLAMLRDELIYDRVKQRIGITFFADSNYRDLIARYDGLAGDPNHKMSQLSRKASEWGIEEAWARIALLLDSDPHDYARDADEFMLRVEEKKAQRPWQNAAEEITNLGDKGTFDSVLTFILQLDKFGIGTREGGRR